MGRTVTCASCGEKIQAYSNPAPTVDIVIAHPGRGIVLIERRNPPYGWALPGGFVDYGESVESAAVREALEETNLPVVLRELLGVWSDPARDKRLHTISTVFVAVTDRPEVLRAGDDASKALFFPMKALPERLAFDHGLMLERFAERFAGRYGV